MKKILILLCLICSMSASAEILKTDNPNRYLKNYVCGDYGVASFNAVNKSKDFWNSIMFTLFDSDGDPIDNMSWTINVGANSGKAMNAGGVLQGRCNALIFNKFKVKTR